MSARLLLPLLGLILLALAWGLWPAADTAPEDSTPRSPETRIATEGNPTLDDSASSSAAALPRAAHLDAEEAEDPGPPPLPESIIISSTSGLPVRRVVIERWDGKVERTTLEAPGNLPLQGFNRYDVVYPAGHYGRQLLHVDGDLVLSPALELRITGLPEDVLRDPSSIQVVSLPDHTDGAQEWQFDTGVVDGVWVLALSSRSKWRVENPRTLLRFPKLPGSPTLQLLHGSFRKTVVSVPWHEIARTFPQTTVQEFKLDHAAGLHTSADWEVLILDADGHPAFTETIREGDWGTLHGKLARTVTAQEHGPTLTLASVPVGMRVAALATCPCGHYTWFPAEVAGRSGRIGTPRTRPSYRGMVHVQESVEPGKVPLLHDLRWSGTIEPQPFRNSWDPLPRADDGSFHLDIPLAAEDFLAWDRLGGRPEDLTLHIGAGRTNTAFQVKKMHWDGIVDFDPMLLARKTPALILHAADLDSDATDLYYQQDFDTTRRGIRLVEKPQYAGISAMVAKGGSWEVYLQDDAAIPPGPDYLRLGYRSPKYFRKESRGHYREMEDVSYHVVISEAFRGRHGGHGLTALVGGLVHSGSLEGSWGGTGDLEIHFQAPTDGVVLTVEEDGRSGQDHIYPLKPGRQVLE